MYLVGTVLSVLVVIAIPETVHAALLAEQAQNRPSVSPLAFELTFEGKVGRSHSDLYSCGVDRQEVVVTREVAGGINVNYIGI